MEWRWQHIRRISCCSASMGQLFMANCSARSDTVCSHVKTERVNHSYGSKPPAPKPFLTVWQRIKKAPTYSSAFNLPLEATLLAQYKLKFNIKCILHLGTLSPIKNVLELSHLHLPLLLSSSYLHQTGKIYCSIKVFNDLIGLPILLQCTSTSSTKQRQTHPLPYGHPPYGLLHNISKPEGLSFILHPGDCFPSLTCWWMAHVTNYW